MPKTKISEYSATANSNTDVASINIDEGCAPSGINNAIRAVMGHLKDFQQGTNSDPFNGPVNGTVGATTPATGAFTTLSASSTLTVTGAGSIQGLTVGKGAGSVATNTAVGASALAANTSGAFVIAVGANAGLSNTTGSNNAFVGRAAGYTNTTGSSNTVVGDAALYYNTTGGSNTAVGSSAGQSNTTGIQNSFLGRAAGFTNSTGSYNSFLGDASAYYNTTGSYNVAVGQAALQSNTTASSNTAVGYQAAYSNTTGANNVAYGYQALYANTTANYNAAFGYSALYANSTGTQNSASGNWALYSNTTGSYNTAQGYQALNSNTTASNNTAVGYQAGYTVTDQANNVFLGYQAGYATTGYRNTFIGTSSGSAVTSGNKNTILGEYTGNQGGLDIRTANNYIVLSDGDGNPRGVFDSSGNLLVGATAASEVSNVGLKLFASATVPAYRCVMDTATGTAAGYILYNGNATNNGYRFYVQSNGGIANYQANNTNLSDERTKTEIKDAGNYLAKICAIPVRTFKYKDQTDDLLNLGVIAQDVEAVAPELVDTTGFGETPEDGVPLKAIYQTDLQYALMKAIQELKAEFDAYKATHP